MFFTQIMEVQYRQGKWTKNSLLLLKYNLTNWLYEVMFQM